MAYTADYKKIFKIVVNHYRALFNKEKQTRLHAGKMAGNLMNLVDGLIQVYVAYYVFSDLCYLFWN